MHHAHLTEALTPTNPLFMNTLDGLKASGLTAEQALVQMNRLIDQQAYTRAADDVFLASSMMFLALISLIWLTRRPAPHAANAATDAGGAH